jgi:uncharacterized protein YaaQ
MSSSTNVDRVAIITLLGDSADLLARRLTEIGFKATIIESRGSFMMEPSSTLLIGFPSSEQNLILETIRELCCTRKRMIPVQSDGTLMPTLPMLVEAEFGGASVIALAVERFIQL